MKIAKCYLSEIEDICNFKHSLYVENIESLEDVVQQHWNSPTANGGLFSRCHPITSKHIKCGCLTQIKNSLTFSSEEPDGIRDKEGMILVGLTNELGADDRIAVRPYFILPKHLRDLSVETPLTKEQRDEVKKALLPYAEWQTRLRLKFKDQPIELQEVE